MSMKRIAFMAAVGLLTVPALAGAELSALTATKVRIGNHSGYVRVVVDFAGTLSAREVTADKVTKRLAALHLAHPGASTQTSGRTADGVRASLQPATQGLQIALNFAPFAFKYVSYEVVTGDHLVIDLWKSAPPRKAIATCSGLALQSRLVSPAGVVNVVGSEHGIFENQFQVVVRGTNGKVLGRKTGVHGPGKWSVHVHYSASTPQKGTVEAVAFSPKDGALECLTQAPIQLPAS